MTAPTDDALITGLFRDPVVTVEVDFGRDGYAGIDELSAYVESYDLQRSLTTDVPETARMVAGYGVAQATVGLGSGSTFSPTNTASAYYGVKRIGAPVHIAAGFTDGVHAATMHDRFIGRVRTLSTDGLARSASLEALDGSDHLRSQVLLPMYTVNDHPGLDSRTFIDYILTANGITPSTQDLEPSLNKLTATPFVNSKQDAWTLIQQIAAAEYATAFFDESGLFHFWNRNHFGSGQSVDYTAGTVTAGSTTTPIRKVTSARALKTLTTTEAVDSVKNHVLVHYSTYQIQPVDWVWQSTDPLRIGIRGTRTVTATFDSPCINVSTAVAWIGHGFTTSGRSGYRACRRLDGLGEAVDNLTFTVTVTAQSATITVHNPNPYYCYLVCPQADKQGNLYDASQVAQPMLWLKGQAVVDASTSTTATDGSTGQAADVSDQQSITDAGEQVFEVDAGGWVQNLDTAQELAADLLGMLARPVPYLGDVDVVADPRLRLGDRIELTDDTGMGLDEHCWIVGIRETFTATGGYGQTLTLRMCAGIGGWVLGHPTRSVLGSTTVLGGVY